MTDNEEKYNNLIEALESILEEENSKIVTKNAFKCIEVSRFNVIVSIIMVVMLFPAILGVSFSNHTISSIINIIEVFKDLTITLFGIVFSGYALFQAFCSKELITKMLIYKAKNKNLFQEYNLSFFLLSKLYLAMIIINIVLLMILDNIPQNYELPFFSSYTNNVLTTIFLTLYTFFSIYSILEIRSLIYNIYQAFNINSLNIGIDILNGKEKNNSE